MVQNKLLLSVCVPTYNQPDAVRKLLESLTTQYQSQIEILIRDDSPNNETDDIVRTFASKFPIRYFRGQKEGLDVAIIFLTEEARGLFVWWIGDDVIQPNAVQRLVTLINKHEDLTFIWVNSHDTINKDILSVNDLSSYFFSDSDNVLNLDIGLLGFITATVFKREVATPCLEQAKKHIGSAFVCMYIVLHVIAQRGKCYFLGMPCFSSNHKPPGELRWYDQFQVFGINLFHIVMLFEAHFDKRKIRKALSKNISMVIKAIIVERALGLKIGFASASPKLIPLARLYWSYWIFWALLPLLITPRFILPPFYSIYNKWFSHKLRVVA